MSINYNGVNSNNTWTWLVGNGTTINNELANVYGNESLLMLYTSNMYGNISSIQTQLGWIESNQTVTENPELSYIVGSINQNFTNIIEDFSTYTSSIESEIESDVNGYTGSEISGLSGTLSSISSSLSTLTSDYGSINTYLTGTIEPQLTSIIIQLGWIETNQTILIEPELKTLQMDLDANFTTLETNGTLYNMLYDIENNATIYNMILAIQSNATIFNMLSDIEDNGTVYNMLNGLQSDLNSNFTLIEDNGTLYNIVTTLMTDLNANFTAIECNGLLYNMLSAIESNATLFNILSAIEQNGTLYNMMSLLQLDLDNNFTALETNATLYNNLVTIETILTNIEDNGTLYNMLTDIESNGTLTSILNSVMDNATIINELMTIASNATLINLITAVQNDLDTNFTQFTTDLITLQTDLNDNFTIIENNLGNLAFNINTISWIDNNTFSFINQTESQIITNEIDEYGNLTVFIGNNATQLYQLGINSFTFANTSLTESLYNESLIESEYQTLQNDLDTNFSVFIDDFGNLQLTCNDINIISNKSFIFTNATLNTLLLDLLAIGTNATGYYNNLTVILNGITYTIGNLSGGSFTFNDSDIIAYLANETIYDQEMLSNETYTQTQIGNLASQLITTESDLKTYIDGAVSTIDGNIQTLSDNDLSYYNSLNGQYDNQLSGLANQLLQVLANNEYLENNLTVIENNLNANFTIITGDLDNITFNLNDLIWLSQDSFYFANITLDQILANDLSYSEAIVTQCNGEYVNITTIDGNSFTFTNATLMAMVYNETINYQYLLLNETETQQKVINLAIQLSNAESAIENYIDNVEINIDNTITQASEQEQSDVTQIETDINGVWTLVNQTDTDVLGLTNLTTIEYNALTILINNMNVSIYNAISMANINVTGENTTEEMAILQNIFFLSNSSLSALNITNSYLPILYAEYQSILSKLTNETITINGTTYGFNNSSNVIFTVQME